MEGSQSCEPHGCRVGGAVFHKSTHLKRPLLPWSFGSVTMFVRVQSSVANLGTVNIYATEDLR